MCLLTYESQSSKCDTVHCVHSTNESVSSNKTVSSNKAVSNNCVSSNMTMTTAVGSMESIGRVMDSSYAGSEGLGLGGGSVLSLVRLGDGLVRDLASTTVDRSSVDSVGSVDNKGYRDTEQFRHR